MGVITVTASFSKTRPSSMKASISTGTSMAQALCTILMVPHSMKGASSMDSLMGLERITRQTGKRFTLRNGRADCVQK